MKLAILSDIHENFNTRNTGVDIVELLKSWIAENKPDVFVLAGDLSKGPDRSLAKLEEIQEHVPDTKLLYVHGNHDIYHDNSHAAYNILRQFSGNLANGPVELNDEWVILGDGAWYDYSFGIEGFTPEQFAAGTYNELTWPDMLHAHWHHSDPNVAMWSFSRIEDWLYKQKEAGKNIIMVTHMVPFRDYVQYKGDLSWDFFNALTGSEMLGEFAVNYGVKKYIFGHIHTRHHEERHGMEIICNPLGYFPREWNSESAEEEIKNTIKVIEI